MTAATQRGDDGSAAARAFREEWGRVVAALARAFGDLDLAEDAAQEAFEVATRTWPETGVPDNRYVATTGDSLDRPDLCDEAIHLARTLLRLMPDEPEVRGLLALLLLVAARRHARVGDDGALVPLGDQDRTRWDTALVAEGHALVRHCLRLGRPGPCQLHAAMNAVHVDATTAEATDWAQILALHDQLIAIAPTPVAALNRAVAVAEVHGPGAALALVDGLELEAYHLWHATRGDLLDRLGDHEGAAAAFRAALSRTRNDGERQHLQRRLGRAERAAGEAPQP